VPRRSAPRPSRGRPRQRQARPVDEIRPGTWCVILLDCREGEPDRTGAKASFEGFFDPETGDPRRQGFGIPRLRIAEPAGGDAPHTPERVWGFEVWWRLDPDGAGLIAQDREELELSKRLLRGLVRDSRRQVRLRTEVPASSRTTGP